MSDKLAYSVAEAAEALSVSAWLLREEIAQGRIRTVQFGRRVVTSSVGTGGAARTGG